MVGKAPSIGPKDKSRFLRALRDDKAGVFRSAQSGYKKICCRNLRGFGLPHADRTCTTSSTRGGTCVHEPTAKGSSLDQNVFLERIC